MVDIRYQSKCELIYSQTIDLYDLDIILGIQDSFPKTNSFKVYKKKNEKECDLMLIELVNSRKMNQSVQPLYQGCYTCQKL